MKAAVELDFLESISLSCTHKGTRGLKAASVAPAQSWWQTEPQLFLNSSITIHGAIGPPLKGKRLSKEK